MSEMKKCPNCGAEMPAENEFCTACGANNFYGAAAQQTNPVPPAPLEPLPEKPVNVPAGIAGAVLFALAGGALYFGIYQIGIIAGLCGFIMFFLANLGYGIFSGNMGKTTVTRIVTCIVVTVVILFLAEYVSVAFDIYKAIKAEGFAMSFSDVLRGMPELFSDKEFAGKFFLEYGLALLVAAVATATTVAKMVKYRDKPKA